MSQSQEMFNAANRLNDNAASKTDLGSAIGETRIAGFTQPSGLGQAAGNGAQFVGLKTVPGTELELAIFELWNTSVIDRLRQL
jgi:hypothetical protein